VKLKQMRKEEILKMKIVIIMMIIIDFFLILMLLFNFLNNLIDCCLKAFNVLYKYINFLYKDTIK
jgi:hypothetical protein